MKNTREGLGLVTAGLDWRRGDQVVTCDLEYPSNVYPWWSLVDRGVETLMVPGESGRLPLERVPDALRSSRVRLLALSSVDFGSGARNDLDAIGRLCQERGVLFCVDAIQSVGCLPLDVERLPAIEIKTLEEQENRAGEPLLEATQRTLKRGGLTARTILKRGDAATEIIQYARENQVDLIVCGSRGLSQLAGWLLGTVSRKLLHYASCSVLVVK